MKHRTVPALVLTIVTTFYPPARFIWAGWAAVELARIARAEYLNKRRTK